MKKLFFFVLMGIMNTSFGAKRNVMVALPLTSSSPLKVEFNVSKKISFSVDYTGLANSERVLERELKENPNASLMMGGREFGVSVSRFADPNEMSGFHWGLGLGYKQVLGEWSKTPYGKSKAVPVLDHQGNVNHLISAEGLTVSARGGYRFVGDSVGFAASIFLMLKHFQNRIRDVDPKDPDSDIEYSQVAYHDKMSLQRRMTTSVFPGIEIGWAF